MALTIVGIVLSGTLAPAQRNQRPTTSARSSIAPGKIEPLTPSSLLIDGVNSKNVILPLYEGSFDKVPIERGSPELFALYAAYLDRFAQVCSNYLPSNKVPMTTYFCEETQTPVNKYGGRVGLDSCRKPSRRPIPGEFAAPEDEAASIQLEDAMQTSLFARVFQSLKTNNSATSALKVTSDAVISSDDAGRDMTTLFHSNACTSAALNRLRNNMRLYAQNQPALRLSDGDGQSLKTPTTETGKAEAYYQLGESLIERATVDPRTQKITAPPGCADAYRSYLRVSPDGVHAAKAKEVLATLGEREK